MRGYAVLSQIRVLLGPSVKSQELFEAVTLWSLLYRPRKNMHMNWKCKIMPFKVTQFGNQADFTYRNTLTWQFLRGYNFWTNDLILNLKAYTRLYSFLEKKISFRTCLIKWLISYRLMKSARCRTVPIWFHHTVSLKLHRFISQFINI